MYVGLAFDLGGGGVSSETIHNILTVHWVGLFIGVELLF